MTTSTTFAKFKSINNSKETCFFSFEDLVYSGTPIDDMGDEMEILEGLYDSKFEKIIGTHIPSGSIKTSPAEKPEFISVTLTKDEFPVAVSEKVAEMKEEGFDQETIDNEIKYFTTTPQEIEIIYEKGYGIFAVESESVSSCRLTSPFSKRPVEFSE